MFQNKAKEKKRFRRKNQQEVQKDEAKIMQYIMIMINFQQVVYLILRINWMNQMSQVVVI